MSSTRRWSRFLGQATMAFEPTSPPGKTSWLFDRGKGDDHQAQVDESTIALEMRQAMLDGQQSEKDRAVARHR
jgi:hypothetical protein